MIHGVPLRAKTSPEPSGYALSTVVVKDLQVDSLAGEAQDHKNPSLELEISLVSQDGSKDVWKMENGGWTVMRTSGTSASKAA